MSKAAVYHYFAGKDALILAPVRRLFDTDQSVLHQLVADAAPALDRLRAYGVDLVALLEQERALAPVFWEIRARADCVEVIQSVIGDRFLGYVDAFTAVVQQGLDRGELNARRGSKLLAAEDVALAYVLLVERAILAARDIDQPLATVMSTTVEIFLAALSPRPDELAGRGGPTGDRAAGAGG